MNEKAMASIKNNLDMSVIEENCAESGIVNNNSDDDMIVQSSAKNNFNKIIEDIDDDNLLLSSDDSCDFSESMMLENTLVLLPRITNIHQLNSLQLKELIRRETKKNKLKTLASKKRMCNSSIKLNQNTDRTNDKPKENDDKILNLEPETLASTNACLETKNQCESENNGKNNESKKCLIF